MIGGLPEQTVRAIAESIVFNLALMAGTILLAVIVAAALLFTARRIQGSWRGMFRIVGTVPGIAAAVAAVAFGLVLASL